MSAKHTPAPWDPVTLEEWNNGIDFFNREPDAYVFPVDVGPEDIPLISAAPELLELLIEIDKRVIFDASAGFDRAFNERVEAAIAKATGEAT